MLGGLLHALKILQLKRSTAIPASTKNTSTIIVPLCPPVELVTICSTEPVSTTPHVAVTSCFPASIRVNATGDVKVPSAPAVAAPTWS
jgi:hypothetical protein